VWRWFILALAALFLPLSAGSGASSQPVGATTLSGGGLPFAVRLSASDEEAFRRRLAPPEPLEELQRPSGAAYTLTSSYWEHALTYHDPDVESVAAEAAYFPADGLVRARQGGEDAWLVLELRQRAILDRYLRFAREGRIGPEPGVFEVLRAAASTEPITITVADRELTQDEARRFWEASQSVQLRRDLIRGTPEAPWPPAPTQTTVWITFTLDEGRSVELLYSVVTGVLLDRFATELYPVPRDWLVPVLGSAADFRSPDYDLTPAQIEQQPDRGSQLWWLLAIAAVAGLGVAIWLRRTSTGA
jgi:hypothetical protein